MHLSLQLKREMLIPIFYENGEDPNSILTSNIFTTIIVYNSMIYNIISL